MDGARIARVFEHGLAQPVGYVLPVERSLQGGWLSEHWKTRSGRIQLIPGDSAMGLRLPLNSLPYIPPSARSFVPPPDPFEPLPPLGPRDASGQAHLSNEYRNGHDKIPAGEVLPEPHRPAVAVRTAMTIEPRDGRLCIFMAPTNTAADYFALLNAIEDASERLGVSVHIEGYPPPYDPRINVLKVTPDPGVIEVNIHPAKNWQEQMDITKIVYEEAAAPGLSAEKFLLDGRHNWAPWRHRIRRCWSRPAIRN